MLPEYYTKLLYPLQNKVLRILETIVTDFYLTGGTALSRNYLHHRFSDDLDFFVNRIPDFKSQVQLCIDTLKVTFFDNVEIAISGDSFARIFINTNEVSLKIEFINDVGFRVNKPIQTKLFIRTDNIENILSNKICALSRDEPKDIADILFISAKYNFNWKEIIDFAKNKDAWVDESEVLIILEKFDIKRLSQVNWIDPINFAEIENKMPIIIQDILLGKSNSLCIN